MCSVGRAGVPFAASLITPLTRRMRNSQIPTMRCLIDIHPWLPIACDFLHGVLTRFVRQRRVGRCASNSSPYSAFQSHRPRADNNNNNNTTTTTATTGAGLCWAPQANSTFLRTSFNCAYLSAARVDGATLPRNQSSRRPHYAELQSTATLELPVPSERRGR